MIVLGRPSTSSAVKKRPWRKVTPMASKYPSLATIWLGETSDSPGFIWYPSAKITLSL